MTQVPHKFAALGHGAHSPTGSSLHKLGSRTRWLQQPLHPALLEALITRVVLLVAHSHKQAEGENQHDGQQDCGYYPVASWEPYDILGDLRGNHVGEIEHIAQSPAHIYI